MGVIPCEIPLLEFDPEQTAVIGPDYEQLNLHLPRKCVFAFLGGCIDRCAHAAGARQVATFNSATKLYPIYVTTYHGQEVALCQAPVGAAAAAQLLAAGGEYSRLYNAQRALEQYGQKGE